ncbi:MAG: hypothetical protein FMNOHCHN_03710 [Ignavibacteriaceae bacterium]|nr:hypothetical protein [Ignavibacteriaceae bacterium]
MVKNEIKTGGITGWQKAKAQKMNMNPEESQVGRERMCKKNKFESGGFARWMKIVRSDFSERDILLY